MTVSDISPEALARLEAKLLADLEVMRRMRALVEEHRPALTVAAVPAPAAMPAPVPLAAIPVPATPPVPQRPYEEILLECLATLSGRTFVPEELRSLIYKATKIHPGLRAGENLPQPHDPGGQGGRGGAAHRPQWQPLPLNPAVPG